MGNNGFSISSQPKRLPAPMQKTTKKGIMSSIAHNPLILLVGTNGFEPSTSTVSVVFYALLTDSYIYCDQRIYNGIAG